MNVKSILTSVMRTPTALTVKETTHALVTGGMLEMEPIVKVSHFPLYVYHLGTPPPPPPPTHTHTHYAHTCVAIVRVTCTIVNYSLMCNGVHSKRIHTHIVPIFEENNFHRLVMNCKNYAPQKVCPFKVLTSVGAIWLIKSPSYGR